MINSAGSVVLDAAISALVAGQRNGDEEYDPNAHHGRQYQRRATARTAAAAAESSIVSFFQTLVSLIKRTLYISFVSTIILSLSVLTYAAIYQLSMPRLAIRAPIYFDYNFVPERHKSGAYGRHIEELCAQKDGEGGTTDKDTPPTEQALSTSRLRTSGPQQILSPPTAVVDLQMQHTQWHAYYDTVLPASYPDLSDHVIKPRRRYFVDISVTLPESDLNRRLGMFMLEVDLLASDGTMLASSGRPSMLPHESSLIGIARKLVLMGPILIGAVAEARTVVLESFDSYVESPDKPLAAMIVRLVVPSSHGRHRYGESPSSNIVDGSLDYLPIQVHSGEVRIGKELNSIQRNMKEWFYTCGLVAVTILSLMYGIWFLIMRAWFRKQMKLYNAHRMQEEQDEYGYDYDERRYSGFDGSNSDSDWGATNGATGQGDDLSSMSGLAFELQESEESHEADEWDDIDGSNNSQQSSASDNMDKGESGIQSTGEIDAGGGNSMQVPRADARESTDDLETLADELVNDMSFEVDSSRSQGGVSARDDVASFFEGLRGGNEPKNNRNRSGEEKKETDSPSNCGENITRRQRSPLDKKSDTAAAIASARAETPKNKPSSTRTSNHRAGGGGTSSSSNAKKKNTSAGKKKVAKKRPASDRKNRNNDPKLSAKKKYEEKFLAEKVMKGDFSVYEVFTGEVSSDVCAKWMRYRYTLLFCNVEISLARSLSLTHIFCFRAFFRSRRT